MTDRELLRRIERSPGQRAGYKQLVRELSCPEAATAACSSSTSPASPPPAPGQARPRPLGMPSAVATRDNLAAGRLDLHRDGYGFVRPDSRQAGAPCRAKTSSSRPTRSTPPCRATRCSSSCCRPKADGRKLGRIVRVLTRRNPTVVGIFHYARNQRFPENTVTPFDDRMTQPILIPDGHGDSRERPPKSNPNRVLGAEATASEVIDLSNLEGLVVDVEITDFPYRQSPRARPRHRGPRRSRRLRSRRRDDDPQASSPTHLPRDVLAEAREVAHLDPETVAERRDFRDLPIVTIDGETAKDFDDAVLVTENADNTYQLQVHIADVAEYVLTGTDLDLEARLRGNSVYFPDRAVPMLPQELSTDICSLRPAKTASSSAASCTSTPTAKSSATRSAKASSAPPAA
jgi:ribonuclease R